jgi:hypothetical protein
MTTPFVHHHLFEINDNLEIKKESLGNYNYFYIDNFYKRSEDIYQMFQDSWVLNWKLDSNGKNFKDYFDCRLTVPLKNHNFYNENKTTNWLKTVLNLQNEECSVLATNIFSWINPPSSKNIQFKPHQDPSYNILVYLDKINSGGTALYPKIEKDMTPEEMDIRQDITAMKEDIQIIPSVFNRCVIFDGGIPHGGYIEDHSKYSNGNWRYNTVYFFNKV